jgi:hypothetical protein
MRVKISILEELASILTKKEKRDGGIFHFSKQFKIGRLKAVLRCKATGIYADAGTCSADFMPFGRHQRLCGAKNRQPAHG